MVDVDNNGAGLVQVDATLSHTHGTGLDLVSFEWFEDGNLIGQGEITTLSLSVGEHVVTLRVTDNGQNESAETTTVTVLPVGYPVIESLTPNFGDTAGGNSVNINGFGFTFPAEDTTVRFGLYDLTGPSKVTVVDQNTIVVQSVPPEMLGVPVSVTILNPNGESNPATYTYVNGVPIDWQGGVSLRMASFFLSILCPINTHRYFLSHVPAFVRAQESYYNCLRARREALRWDQ